MEEKLYFKPEVSKRKSKNKKEEKEHKFLKLFFFLLFLLVIVLIIIWLLRGSKTISGQYPENVKNEALECTSEETIYEKINEVSSEDRELKVSMVFYGEGNFSSASLKYTLHFPERIDATRAESISHAQFAKALAASGYNFEKFDNKFSIIDGDLILTLYASDGKIDAFSKEYFLVKELENQKLPTNLAEYRKNYESQGFTCKSTLDN